ncbi:hypothetical protein HPB50_001862 [Hyalomma asiaticum]|uniref:Uncharacterized protein n=1 Tax=Hyalomma asiaticum TaxID=266040 RepID=A0ACB7SFP2_HYAAI|nr:hypothetical protein HPB50_001862 [Hyalomma asiaticum]
MDHIWRLRVVLSGKECCSLYLVALQGHMYETDKDWHVTIVAAAAFFFGSASIRSSSIFYLSIMEEFRVCRATASWPDTLIDATSEMAGLLVAVFFEHVNPLSVMTIGSILAWSGVMCSALAPSIVWISLTLGVTHGEMVPAAGSLSHPNIILREGRVFRLPMYYVIVVTWILFNYCFDVFIGTIDDYATDKQMGFLRTVSILPILSVTDIFGGVCLPALVDKELFSRSGLLSTTYFGLGVTTALLPVMTTFLPFVGICLVLTMFMGCGNAMYGVLQADYIRQDRLPVSYGTAGFVAGVLLIAKPFVIGYFRDYQKSYDGLFQMLSVIMFLLGFSWLVVVVYEWHKNMGISEVQQVDRCWYMAAVAFIAQLLMSFSDRCSGFLYVGYMDTFQADRQRAGWPSSIGFIVNFSSGLLVSGLQLCLSLRSIALTGALLTWTGPIAASVTKDITAVTLCMGFIHGLGSGILFVAISTSLMMHFSRYRGITSGIKNLGGTAASVAFPYLMLFIEGLYGFRGCLLLYGGIAMHLSALAMLTKEPPWINGTCTSTAATSTDTPRVQHCHYTEMREVSEKQTRPDCADESSKKSRCKARIGIRTIFTNPVFYVIVLSGAVGYYTQSIFFATVVDFARDKGLSLKESAGVIVYFGLTETVGRLALPLAADRGLVRHSTLTAVSFVAMATSMMLLERSDTLPSFTVGASLFAAFFGAAVTVEGVVIADYLGVDYLSFVFGFTGAVSVPSFFANPFALGFFRDYVGSYHHLYKILAASYLVVGLTWVPVLWHDRYGHYPCTSSIPPETQQRVEDSIGLKRPCHETTECTDVVRGEAATLV